MDMMEECKAFAERWHEATREQWDRNGYTAPGMDHDTYNLKSVKDRAKWIAIDNGTSGAFLCRKEDGLVFHIKGYGRPNLKKCIGHVCDAYTTDRNDAEPRYYRS